MLAERHIYFEVLEYQRGLCFFPATTGLFRKGFETGYGTGIFPKKFFSELPE